MKKEPKEFTKSSKTKKNDSKKADIPSAGDTDILAKTEKLLADEKTKKVDDDKKK